MLPFNVPQPVFDRNPEYITLYELAWNLAHKHIRTIPGMPCSPYMDEAFCDTRIWIWDTCFMTLFCKYAPDIFPGVESFKNLLDVIHGQAELPDILVPDNEPEWTGAVPGTRAKIKIQHPDNPPLFAWAEYENALMTGNLNRVRHLLHETKILQIHYNWLETLREPYTGGGHRTAWTAFPDGYTWKGVCSGMDNTPRGRHAATETRQPGEPFLWVDALAQQALSADAIAHLAHLIGDDTLEQEWRDKHAKKTHLLQELYWDETDGFFHDIAPGTHEKLPIFTPAGFWPLLAGSATPEQARRTAEKVLDPDCLGGVTPWVSLARNDAMFEPKHGQYWRGAVWVPSAYAGMRGLVRYNLFHIAEQTADQLLKTMLETWKHTTPHTIWECYAPSTPEPGRNAQDTEQVRPDFCGWSALMPIAGLLEFLIGIHTANAAKRELHWQLPQTVQGKIGCKNYRFGSVTADLIIENGTCTVHTSEPFTLFLNGTPHPVQNHTAFPVTP